MSVVAPEFTGNCKLRLLQLIHNTVRRVVNLFHTMILDFIIQQFAIGCPIMVDSAI